MWFHSILLFIKEIWQLFLNFSSQDRTEIRATLPNVPIALLGFPLHSNIRLKYGEADHFRYITHPLTNRIDRYQQLRLRCRDKFQKAEFTFSRTMEFRAAETAIILPKGLAAVGIRRFGTDPSVFIWFRKGPIVEFELALIDSGFALALVTSDIKGFNKLPFMDKFAMNIRFWIDFRYDILYSIITNSLLERLCWIILLCVIISNVFGVFWQKSLSDIQQAFRNMIRPDIAIHSKEQ